tara:strand:- start:405 stop:698 length:294 start_codon:yes stop_codon:yes gene_type:complete
MVEEMIKYVYKLNEEELTELVYAIKDRRDILRYENLKNFKVGDKVKWVHGRGINKENYTGEVYKVNTTTVGIKTSNKPWSRWRISPSMLTKIKGDES